MDAVFVIVLDTKKRNTILIYMGFN